MCVNCILTACQINVHLFHSSFLTVHDHCVCVHAHHPFMHVCLVIDFSVANPSVGLRGSPSCPNGDFFSADITSPGRPLLRSQSFHNAPGKWPSGPPSGAYVKRPRIVYCFNTLKICYSPLAKNKLAQLPHNPPPPLLRARSWYCSDIRMAPSTIPTPQSFRLCLLCSRASWVITSPEGRFLAFRGAVNAVAVKA